MHKYNSNYLTYPNYFDISEYHLIHTDLRELHPKIPYLSNFESSKNMLKEKDLNYVPLFEGKLSLMKNAIPLIPTEAYAGYGAGEVSIKEQDIQDRYIVPEFTNVDFMIRIKGSSMYPKFSSGDVVACKIITDSKFIQWNKVHVFSTREQGVLVKRLKKSENPECFLAVSDNLNYDPFDIPKEEILNLAIVTGVIRLE